MSNIVRVALRAATVALALAVAGRAFAQEPTPPPVIPVARITSPIKDQDVRNTLVIVGSAVAPGFTRYEIAYALEPEATNWIIIGGNNQPVPNGVLQAWNTRPLADGLYALRLQVFSSDGAVNESIVRNIKMVNVAQAAATTAPGASTDTASGGQRANELESARNTLDQLVNTAERLPSAFVRGLRWAAIGLAGLIGYAVLKKLALAAAARLFRKPVDYGT